MQIIHSHFLSLSLKASATTVKQLFDHWLCQTTTTACELATSVLNHTHQGSVYIQSLLEKEEHYTSVFGAIQDFFKEKTTTFVFTAWKMMCECSMSYKKSNLLEMLLKHDTELRRCGLPATSEALSIQTAWLASPSAEALIQIAHRTFTHQFLQESIRFCRM